MYKIIGYSSADAGVREYVVDTIVELDQIACAMGSTAFCFENMSIYIMDGEGNWRLV